MLPAPNLDDRRFQDLVDDAKRLVAAALPGVDRPQRLRPGRHAHRGVRVHGRRAATTGSTACPTGSTSPSSTCSASRCTRRRPPASNSLFRLSAPQARAGRRAGRHRGRHAARPRTTSPSSSRRRGARHPAARASPTSAAASPSRCGWSTTRTPSRRGHLRGLPARPDAGERAAASASTTPRRVPRRRSPRVQRPRRRRRPDRSAVAWEAWTGRSWSAAAIVGGRHRRPQPERARS